MRHARTVGGMGIAIILFAAAVGIAVGWCRWIDQHPVI